MEAGLILLMVLALIIAIAIGVIIGYLLTKRRYEQDIRYTQGTLNIDCVDPEFEPGLFLALSMPVKDVVSRKYVSLDVNVMS